MKPDVALAKEVERLNLCIKKLTADLASAEERYHELRHRIKNELFAHTILFTAQGRKSTEPERCYRCVARTNAVAALHEALDSDYPNVCRLDVFLPSLTRTFLAALDSEVECQVSVETTNGLALEARRVQSIGLFLAEALMNAHKHGFSNKAQGKIHILLRASHDQKLHLAIENDGESYDPAAPVGTGLRQMQSIARELNGVLRLEQLSPGMRVQLAFPRQQSSDD